MLTFEQETSTLFVPDGIRSSHRMRLVLADVVNNTRNRYSSVATTVLSKVVIDSVPPGVPQTPVFVLNDMDEL